MVNVADLIGIPYKPHGRGDGGYDCYGLVIEVGRRFGVELPDFDYQSYSDNFITEKISIFETNRHAIKIGVYTEGAILLFTNQSGYKNHIGVYLGDNTVIHCNKKGVHIDRLDAVERFISGVYVWQK